MPLTEARRRDSDDTVSNRDCLRTLIINLVTGDEPALLDTYFAKIAEPASSMEIPSNAVTYLLDDRAHAIEMGAKHGIKILSPEETEQALPHFWRTRC
jgi:hypothetical protein